MAEPTGPAEGQPAGQPPGWQPNPQQPPNYGQQPPPGYGYAQPGPAQPPPRKRRPLLWILLGSAALILICCIGAVVVISNSGSDDSSPDNDQGSAAGAGIGTPVRDGKFEFVVQKVECGVPSVGTEPLGKQAQGQFCLVSITVKNIGNEAQTLSDSDQKAIASNDAEYSTDSEAVLYANENNQQVWLTEINPGNQVTGVLVFDVPKDVQLSRLELHDSTFSNGVEVKVQ